MAGEGVLGLRRAFMPAGVKTLVMSLWSVPDEATKELMVDFYRRTLAGEGRTAALRNA
ncbi:MAG: CHAT domain-containing protein [Halobacteriota archaeon]